MTDVDIGWWGLAASLLLVVVVVAVSSARRLRLEADLVVATVRAVGQLVLAGWALTLLLDDDVSIAWAWLWVAAMVPAAAWSARRRESSVSAQPARTNCPTARTVATTRSASTDAVPPGR